MVYSDLGITISVTFLATGVPLILVLYIAYTLKKSKFLLYLGDNCGEIVFDKIFKDLNQKEGNIVFVINLINVLLFVLFDFIKSAKISPPIIYILCLNKFIPNKEPILPPTIDTNNSFDSLIRH